MVAVLGELDSLPPRVRRAYEIAFDRALDLIAPAVRARGLAYARERAVLRVTVTEAGITAVVQGTMRYTVELTAREGRLAPTCECPAFLPPGCKHVAALLFILGARPRTAQPVDPFSIERPKPAHPRPPIVEAAATAPIRIFANRLSAYAGVALPAPTSGWRTLGSVWDARGPSDERLVAAIERHGEEVLRVVDELRDFQPAVSHSFGEPYGDFYELLADRYRERARHAVLTENVPGPLDERHPGFSFRYVAASSLLSVREERSALGVTPLALDITVPLEPGDPIHVYPPATGADAVVCAWELFALRRLLLELVEPTSDAVKGLERELSRPGWSRVLDRLTPPKAAKDRPAADAENSFVVAALAGRFDVLARTRRAGTDTKWKNVALAALAQGTAPATALERRIARLAVARSGSGPNRGSSFEAGSPLGHELLSLLAEHPRVSGFSRDSEVDAPLRLFVGELSLALDVSPAGAAEVVFRVGQAEVPPAAFEGSLDRGASTWWGYSGGDVLASILVPKELQPWLEARIDAPASLSFPSDALKELVDRVGPLAQRGLVEVPKVALGAELAFEPQAALRVEWMPEGSATFEMLVSPHPAAPLIELMDGPTLYAFQERGRRVFVERDLAAELAVLSRARDAMPKEVLFDPSSPRRGFTEGPAESLALVEHIRSASPPLRVEVRRGAPPALRRWDDSTQRIAVTREGTWFAVRGDVRVGDRSITLGEVLDAARSARCFVPVGDGAFLEIPPAVQARLAPVAAAIDLGKVTKEGGLVHDAFAEVLVEAESAFRQRQGLDLAAQAVALRAARGAAIRPTIEEGQLRPYQVEGARWMLSLAAWASGCVLADDMGLGKTVQTAAVLLARASLGPALVVAPASVSSNWRAELARFVPSLRVRWLNEERDLDVASLGRSDVLVVSYGLLANDGSRFAGTRFATLVLDEAQYLKNAGAKRSSVVRRIERDFTIALTGTPLENHLGDLYALFDQVMPGLLGGAHSFRDRFRKPIEQGDDKGRLAVLVRLVAPFLLRRTRRAVLEELPPLQEITHMVDLSDEEARRYGALRKACELELTTKREKGEPEAQTRIALLAALTRLRQLACDVSLVEPKFTGGSTKLDEATSLCVALAGEGNRALVFSQFTTLLERARARLVAAGLRVAYLAGDTPTVKRRELVDAFQRGEHDVFCISLKAGGTGINLTHANYVVHLDPWWNPAVEEQATARAHRMGQTEPVTVYRLVSRGTIEEAILELHARKRDLAGAVLEGRAEAIDLDPDALLELVRFRGRER